MESLLTPNYVDLESIPLSMTTLQIQTEKDQGEQPKKNFVCHCSPSSLDLAPSLCINIVLVKRDFINPRIPHNSVEGFLLYATVRI